MKVQNMTNRQGRAIPNQILIYDSEKGIEYFQSYQTIIAKKVHDPHLGRMIYLDRDKWDYSTTTGKYRNQFLGENKKETEKKIKNGEYILTDLNN